MRFVTAARLALVAAMAMTLTLPAQAVEEPGETGSPGVEVETLEEAEVDRARELYLLRCSSCHGAEGRGTERTPSLETSGAAAAYYYLATGRMPMADYDDQPLRKDLLLSPDQIELLVAYVAGLSDGPPLPDVDPGAGDLSRGGVLYRANCAACHAAAGIGGALSYGQAAPTITQADPLVIGAAVRAGPGLMPVFDEGILDPEELDSVIRYALALRDPATPGGATLGGAGPVPEGFVGWVFGVGMLLLATFWIGRLHSEEAPEGTEDETGSER